MKDKRHWLILGATALVTASLLSGCSSSGSKDSAQSLEAEPPTLVAQDQTAATQARTGPAGLKASWSSSPQQ